MQISSKTAASLDELLAAASNEKVLRIIVTLVNRKIPTSTLPPASFPSATGKGIAIERSAGASPPSVCSRAGSTSGTISD